MPALETVVDAIASEMAAIASIGTIHKRDHHLEDDVEHFRTVQDLGTAQLDIWYIGLEAQDAVEGPGVGENYAIYRFRIRHINIRKSDVDWLKTARAKGQQVADKLEKNPAVFRIGGQPQLVTPETVSLEGYDRRSVIESEIFGPQTVVEGFVRLAVEARRWT